MKEIQISSTLARALAAFSFLLLSSCGSNVEITSDNPHSCITDKHKAEVVSSLKELDPERLYEMNYTCDYKLDELIETNVESVPDLIKFMASNIFDVAAADRILPSFSAGCSAYAATEAVSGDFLMGRNYDYCHVRKGVEMPATALLVRTSPSSGKKSISMVDAYWLGYDKGFYNDGKTDLSMLLAAPYELLDGMNEDGFAICVLHLDGNATRQNEPGRQLIWANPLMRKLLDSAGTVEEAVALAGTYNVSMKTPAKGNLHFFLADATGDYAILEYSYEDGADSDTAMPNVMKVLRGEDCYRYVTNFYVDPALAENKRLGPLGGHGLWRYDTLKVNLEKNAYKLDGPQAMGLLKAVSQDSHPGNNTSHTQWSAVYNLTQKTVELSILQEYGNTFSFSIL